MTNGDLHKLFYVVAWALGALASVAVLASWLYGKRSDEEKAARSAVTGVLRPTAAPERPRFPFPDVEFGDSGAALRYAGPAGAPLLRIAEDSALTVALDERGLIRVSTLVRDASGGAVAELVENEWRVNPGGAWDRNHNGNALEVRDRSGDVVLQVRLVGNRVQLQMKTFDAHGNGFFFGKGIGPEGVGGIIEMTGPMHPSLEARIQPIFRYPSDRHLGELAL